MKKTTKTLKLDSTTIRTLSTETLNRAAGAAVPITRVCADTEPQTRCLGQGGC